MKQIDPKTWPRKESFTFFKTFENPLFNVCAQPEITHTYDFLESHGISKFNAMLWMLTHAANAVPQIRQRIRENQIVEHEKVHPSFTILTGDKTLAFCKVLYTSNVSSFFDDVEQGIARINFTSITHPRKNDLTDFIPRISWGKFTHTPAGARQADKKTFMPVSIQLHHGLADGYHVGLFFEMLESMLSQPESISWPIP